MPISPYYAALRQRLGTALLLIPAVAAVVHDQTGRVLIQGSRHGGYSLPAGAIEPGEQPARAVAREVFEETGLVVRPSRLLGVFGGSEACRVRYPNGDRVEYTVCLFSCAIVSGHLTCRDGESASLQFCHINDVPRLTVEYPRQLLGQEATGLSFQWSDDWLCGL